MKTQTSRRAKRTTEAGRGVISSSLCLWGLTWTVKGEDKPSIFRLPNAVVLGGSQKDEGLSELLFAC